jgi:hypothetical protein
LLGHFVVAALKKSQHFNCAEGGENQGSWSHWHFRLWFLSCYTFFMWFFEPYVDCHVNKRRIFYCCYCNLLGSVWKLFCDTVCLEKKDFFYETIFFSFFWIHVPMVSREIGQSNIEL